MFLTFKSFLILLRVLEFPKILAILVLLPYKPVSYKKCVYAMGTDYTALVMPFDKLPDAVIPVEAVSVKSRLDERLLKDSSQSHNQFMCN